MLGVMIGVANGIHIYETTYLVVIKFKDWNWRLVYMIFYLVKLKVRGLD